MSLINTDADRLNKIFANWSQKYVERILSHYSSIQSLSPVWGFCDPMECSIPGFPVHLQLLQLAQSNPSSRWCHPTISSSVIPFSSCLQSFPESGSFPVIQFFASRGQILKWICRRYTCVPHPEPSSLLPPHTITLGRPSAPAPSIQYRALNLDWQLFILIFGKTNTIK